MQNIEAENKLTFIINNTMTVLLGISWISLYKKRFVRFIEYANLVVISIYHLTTFFDVVHHYLVPIGGSLGDFIVWMPIYIVFIFLTLGIRTGLMFSIGIFVITVIDGVMNMKGLSTESMDSLFQYYFANLIYIIVLYYAQHMFKAYARAELFKKHAYLDALTGIPNRHKIDEWLDKKLRDSQKIKAGFSIIFFDIDHFKKINDLFGHKTGDSVLIELAELIQKNLAIGDLFGRWGGEEFIIIPKAAGEGAIRLAEELRKVVEEHEFGNVGRLTASFGVADSKPEDDIDSILNRVDEGLYQSKNYGRNKVSCVY